VKIQKTIEILLVGEACDELLTTVKQQLQLDGDIVVCAGSASCLYDLSGHGMLPEAIVLVDRAIGDFGKTIQEIAKINTSIPSIVISSTKDPGRVQEYFRAGASDVILWEKESKTTSKRLLGVIKRACKRNKNNTNINNIKKDIEIELQQAEIRGEFRMLLSQELDIDRSLCVALEYISNRVSCGNALVLRPNGEEPRVGAYINSDFNEYEFPTIARRLGRSVWSQVFREQNIIRFTDSRGFAVSNGLAKKLEVCDIISAPCQFKNKCVAALVFFRSNHMPFTTDEGRLILNVLPELSSRIARLEVLSFHGDFKPKRPAA
jgi:DNA-binding NarL/FixJ family response regulator